MLQVPVVASNIADWIRKAANTINGLRTGAVLKDGADIYTAPTISNPPTQAEVQALADALEVVSNRLK